VVKKGRFNPNCVNRILDIKDPYGRYDLRILVIFLSGLCFICDVSLIGWSYGAHHDEGDTVTRKRVLISFICNLFFSVFSCLAYVTVHEATLLPMDTENQFTSTHHQIETAFRRYALCYIMVQVLFIVYLSFMIAQMYLTAYFLDLVCVGGYLLTSTDMFERLTYWRSKGYQLNRPHIVIVFFLCSFAAESVCIGSTFILTSDYQG
jgi:hypothetical protein